MNTHKILSVLGIVVVMVGAYILGSRQNTAMQVVAPRADTATTQTPSVDTATSTQTTGGVYPYTDAPNHVGEMASITGTVIEVYTAKSGVTFLDFCKSYKTCPFTAVIFSSSAQKFTDIKSLTGPVIITGLIKSYQGKAEIIIDDPSQIVK